MLNTLARLRKLEDQVSAIQMELSAVAQLTLAVQQLQSGIDILSSRVACLPVPARASWERHSAPAWEHETITLPSLAVRRASRSLKLLAPVRRIARVTLCMSGTNQFISAYDAAGERIEEYCGLFHEIGASVLEAAGNLEWEIVAESA